MDDKVTVLPAAYCAAFHFLNKNSCCFDLYAPSGESILGFPEPSDQKSSSENSGNLLIFGPNSLDGGEVYLEFDKWTYYNEYALTHPRIPFVEAAFRSGVNYMVFDEGYLALSPISTQAFMLWQKDIFMKNICEEYLTRVKTVFEYSISDASDTLVRVYRKYWTGSHLVEYRNQPYANGLLKKQLDELDRPQATATRSSSAHATTPRDPKNYRSNKKVANRLPFLDLFRK